MGDRLPRKLAAILYADVAGYSRLTGEDEDATHRTLIEYLDLISAFVVSHSGQVMHYAGDAVLAKFDAVVDSMLAAVSIQSELNSRNLDVPVERRVQFRIGVNLGDIIEQSDGPERFGAALALGLFERGQGQLAVAAQIVSHRLQISPLRVPRAELIDLTPSRRQRVQLVRTRL